MDKWILCACCGRLCKRSQINIFFGPKPEVKYQKLRTPAGYILFHPRCVRTFNRLVSYMERYHTYMKETMEGPFVEENAKGAGINPGKELTENVMSAEVLQNEDEELDDLQEVTRIINETVMDMVEKDIGEELNVVEKQDVVGKDMVEAEQVSQGGENNI